jgi:hypothetical protein
MFSNLSFPSKPFFDDNFIDYVETIDSKDN